MFMRRTIEILTFVAYWFVAVPMLYEYLVDKKVIIKDANILKDSVYSHGLALFIAVLIYMVAFRISVWVYIKCKKHDIKMYNSMKSLAMDIDELERQAKKLRDQQKAQAMLHEEEKVSKLRSFFKWFPQRSKNADQIQTQNIAAVNAPETPSAQRKKLLDTNLRKQTPPPAPGFIIPTASKSPLPSRPAPKLPVQSPGIQAQIAGLHSKPSVYSSPVLKKKAMTNPGFVSSSGDWV